LPRGGDRGYVGVEGGIFEGPNIKGKVVANSGGDYAYFRPDGVTQFEAFYILEEDDGTRILLNNHGYSWFRSVEAEKEWKAIESGEAEGRAINPEGYYMRVHPTFEVSKGKHDWLTRTVIVGSGARELGGNVIRYYKVV
jgi:hypothetical protein